jgi:hypothetical protein
MQSSQYFQSGLIVTTSVVFRGNPTLARGQISSPPHKKLISHSSSPGTFVRILFMIAKYVHL